MNKQEFGQMATGFGEEMHSVGVCRMDVCLVIVCHISFGLAYEQFVWRGLSPA